MNMTSLRIALLGAALTLCVSPNDIAAQIDWRLSVKVVLRSNGTREPGGSLSTDAGIQAAVAGANDLIRKFGRGYQYRLTEIVDLPGQSSLLDQDCQVASSNIIVGAQSNPTSYAWRNNAVNAYITRTSDTEGCAFNGLLVLNYDTAHKVIVHEGGHFFGLNHTQGFRCGRCSDPLPIGFPPGTCSTIPGDDLIADTLPDLACWDREDISTNFFGRFYTNLLAGEKIRVDLTTSNIMSYRPAFRDVLTSGQLDRVADTSNTTRGNVATGTTWFVDRNNNCTGRTGSSSCTTNGTAGPFQTVTTGVNNAGAGDIVLIRPGNYNEPMTINKAITLRATRGDALIGIP
jgi:hypothetical protein